jgi:hypothetical protein
VTVDPRQRDVIAFDHHHDVLTPHQPLSYGPAYAAAPTRDNVRPAAHGTIMPRPGGRTPTEDPHRAVAERSHRRQPASLGGQRRSPDRSYRFVYALAGRGVAQASQPSTIALAWLDQSTTRVVVISTR